METLYADPRWLIAVTGDGLVCVGPESQLEVELDAPWVERKALLDLLADGADPGAVARLTGSEPDEAEDLLGELERRGALGPARRNGREPCEGIPLAEAIRAVEDGGTVPRVAWTAEEALVIPEGAPVRTARRALRAFVSAIQPHERLTAYGYVARHLERSTLGDVPDPAALDAALERARGSEPSALHVLDLVHGVDESVGLSELGSLGGAQAHRLGPVSRVTSPRTPNDDGMVTVGARYAVSNLTYPGDDTRQARGVATTAEQAELIARAEAVERYASGDVPAFPFLRASASELAGAVPLEALYARNRRQLAESPVFEPYDPSEPYLWTPATARDGSRRWLVAEAVLFPFMDPGRERPVVVASSSGVAAHGTYAAARERAFRELIERDAFMWNWIQRLSRERIDPRSLPDELRDRMASLERDGARVDLVSISLDTLPVVLCATRDDDVLCLGNGCSDDPVMAAAKALEESTLIYRNEKAMPGERVEPEAVRTPDDHLNAHRDPELLEQDRFLWSSPDLVDVHDIPRPPGPTEDLLEEIGETMTLDLTSAATAPFHVVRAVVLGIVPINFGYDLEPLGMPRLAEPKRTVDGRTLGARLDLADSGPLVPHPFP